MQGRCPPICFCAAFTTSRWECYWLPWPVLPKLQWPQVEHKETRAITADEHARIVEREHNPEIRAYYQLLWHLGGSQTDIAELTA